MWIHRKYIDGTWVNMRATWGGGNRMNATGYGVKMGGEEVKR